MNRCDDCKKNWKSWFGKDDQKCPYCDSFMINSFGKTKIQLSKEEVDKLFKEAGLEPKDEG